MAVNMLSAPAGRRRGVKCQQVNRGHGGGYCRYTSVDIAVEFVGPTSAFVGVATTRSNATRSSARPLHVTHRSWPMSTVCPANSRPRYRHFSVEFFLSRGELTENFLPISIRIGSSFRLSYFGCLVYSSFPHHLRGIAPFNAFLL